MPQFAYGFSRYNKLMHHIAIFYHGLKKGGFKQCERVGGGKDK